MVGYELEFSGLDLDQATDALRRALGAEVVSHTSAQRVCRVEGLGEFKIELDWDFLKRKAKETSRAGKDESWIEKIGEVAAFVVPIEIVCPPVPINSMSVLDPMVEALRDAGAVGTEDSLIAAYGVHINTEIPRLDAATICAYLRAYALLQWWLVDTQSVDMARRISPYIDLYSQAYLKRILSREDATLDQVFDDYLEHNPSRNRALDLLPMLAKIDEARVKRVVDDPRIKARPAFHYRLPDCNIEREDWSLQQPWNSWLTVEKLSARADDLDQLARAFLDAERPLIGVNRADWVETMDRWLKDRELA